MTKGELVEAVADSVKISKLAAGEAVDATFANIAKAIKRSRRFQVPGFGTFTLSCSEGGRPPLVGPLTPRH